MIFYKNNADNAQFLLLQKDISTPVSAPEGTTMLRAGTVDASKEKHTPVVTVEGDTVTVSVGSAVHPMADEHYIEWIAIETRREHRLCYLTPEQAPEATFHLAKGDEFIAAYAYCNLHGLWIGR